MIIKERIKNKKNRIPAAVLIIILIVGLIPAGLSIVSAQTPGINTEEVPGNLIHNSSFETADFGTAHTYHQWYTVTNATLTQTGKRHESGNYSLKVSNRTEFFTRAQQRVWFGNMKSGTKYELSGYVQAAEKTSVFLIAVVWGWGGPADNPYPSAFMYLDTAAVNSASWSRLAGTFTVTYAASVVEGKKDAIVTWGDQTATLSAVSGVDNIEIMVQQVYDVTTYPDLYMDSFMLIEAPVGIKDNGENTEDITGNLLPNSSFETNNFGTDHNFGQCWYPNPYNQQTIERTDFHSQSGNYSLKITNRTTFHDRVQFRAGYGGYGNLVIGKEYELSGYVLAAEQTEVQLLATVWGSGGTGTEYPSVAMYLDTDTAKTDAWTLLSGSFKVEYAGSEVKGKKDAIVTWGNQTRTIVGLAEVSCVEITIQQKSGATGFPDLYVDSFLLKNISPMPEALTGHTGAANTELNKDNLIKNASFETNDFVDKEYIFGKWYTMPECPAILTRDTTFSHSGKASLKVSARKRFWHRAEYRVDGAKITMGHPYEVSGYVAFQESATAELLLQVYGAGGPKNDPYPNLVVRLDSALAKSGKWTKLSGTVTITSKKSNKQGYYDYTITVKETGDVYELKNVTMISSIQIMPQEEYSKEETPRQNMYLDSFLMTDKSPKAPEPLKPTGHTGAANTELNKDNLIKNASFETNDFVDEEYIFGKWYTMPGCPAILTRDTTFSHSGKASLKVSARERFWHRAEYRVEGNRIAMGHPYEISGYVAFQKSATADLLLQVYGAGGPKNDPYPNLFVRLDSALAESGKWTKLSGTVTITSKKSNKQGYYDYTITVKETGDVYELKNVTMISCIQIMPQEAYDEAIGHQDMYLDSFLMADKAPKTPMPMPTGHAKGANTEDIEDNLINNSGFESDLFTDVPNFGLWFTNGTGHSIEQVSTYSHSGKHSVRIYNRNAANSTLIYKVEGGNLKLGVEHTLSGYVAAAQETKVSLILTAYGYGGTVENRTYPFKTAVLSNKTVKDWVRLSGSFIVTYEKNHLYLTIGKNKYDIGECIGLSGIEFYVLTDETAVNHTTDLYLDSFLLLAGASNTDGGGDDNVDTETPDDTQKDDYGGNSEDTTDFEKTDDEQKNDGDGGDEERDDVDGKEPNPYTVWIVIGAIVTLCGIGVIVYLLVKFRRKSEE